MRSAAALLALALIAAAPPKPAVPAKTAPVKSDTVKLDAAKPDPKVASPEQKPLWEVAKVAPDAIQVAASTYVVKPGDTLSAVVRATGAGAEAIADKNDLKPPFVLRPGQRLKIPAGRFHTVQKGQSGIAIARAYQVEWSRIIELNHLEEPYTLREGQRLLLPDAKTVAKMTLEERAAAFNVDLTDLATGSEPAVAQKAKPVAPTPSLARQLAPTTPVAEPEVDFGGRFNWPLQGKVIRAYGPMLNGGRNDGVNIAAERGATITAAADGVVVWAGDHPAFGQVILIRHGSGWVTIYGHCDKLLAKRGQSVTRGQAIARVGMTGSSADQPQLFFEILQGRKPVSPMSLLPKRTGNAVEPDDAVEDNSN